jgi:hypothetical protein
MRARVREPLAAVPRPRSSGRAKCPTATTWRRRRCGSGSSPRRLISARHSAALRRTKAAVAAGAKARARARNRTARQRNSRVRRASAHRSCWSGCTERGEGHQVHALGVGKIGKRHTQCHRRRRRHRRCRAPARSPSRRATRRRGSAPRRAQEPVRHTASYGAPACPPGVAAKQGFSLADRRGTIVLPPSGATRDAGHDIARRNARRRLIIICVFSGLGAAPGPGVSPPDRGHVIRNADRPR